MAEIFVMPILPRKPERDEGYQWFPTLRDRHRAILNHGQTLERLRERGGVSWGELVAIVEDRPWREIDKTFTAERVSAEIQRRIAAEDELRDALQQESAQASGLAKDVAT